MTILEGTQGALRDSALETDSLAPDAKKQRTHAIDLDGEECDEVEDVDDSETQTEVEFVKSAYQTSDHGMVIVPMPIHENDIKVPEDSYVSREASEDCEIQEGEGDEDEEEREKHEGQYEKPTEINECITESPPVEETEVMVIELLSDELLENNADPESESGSSGVSKDIVE